MKNVLNPQNIEVGDTVRLEQPDDRWPDVEMKVESVGGRNQNKVFCSVIGYELYATCFKLVKKAKK